jgi:ADP-ribose pyrophosphatase YjhB (NUDIX family)
MNSLEIIEAFKRVKAIADVGLLYSGVGYDRERYTELHELSMKMLSQLSGHSEEVLAGQFDVIKEYPTAKVDIRGILLKDNKVLLVRESADSLWSLPGGWADVGLSPQEVVEKEFKEETGLDVAAKSVLAIFDKKKHPHPPQSFYVYKIVFHCEATSDILEKGFDVLDVNYFDLDNLPPLSENRILKSQIALLAEKIKNRDQATHFE